MKVHVISDSSGRIVAVMKAHASVSMKAREGQHFHEIEVPEHARRLGPDQIAKHLKIHQPGQAPKFTD
jgi:hypothetical protein